MIVWNYEVYLDLRDHDFDVILSTILKRTLCMSVEKAYCPNNW